MRFQGVYDHPLESIGAVKITSFSKTILLVEGI